MSGALLALPGHEALAPRLCAALQAPAIALATRDFPDGESYLRIEDDVKGRAVAVLCTLHEPNPRFLPLAFVADTLRELGATSVGLVAPYLAYMRQDVRFKPGEAISSVYFSWLLSQCFSWLVTVDPHLHRWKSLGDIYDLDARVVPAAPAVGAWIRRHVPNAVLIGPDSESSQWVTAIAHFAGAPFVVLDKTRHGDRDVTIEVHDNPALRGRTPVLVDDIISTAHTMIAVVLQLRGMGLPAPVCIGVHGVFAPEAYRELATAGAERIVTTNTIPHESSEIDMSGSIAAAVSPLIT